MARKLPLQYQQRMPYELLSGLVNCLLNETIFEIVEGLTEIQQVTEKQLLQQRLQLLHRHKAEKEAHARQAVQEELEEAGVPGFGRTTNLQEIQVQMYLLEFIAELSK